MKKLSLILLSMLLIFTLAACGNKCEHIYDNACDATCNECGETRLVQHDYSVLQNDETHHWYTCSVCERPDGENKAKHVFDNDCDTTCNTCGKTRTTEHTPNEDDGDCTTAITCSVCGTLTTPAKDNHTGGTATCGAKAVCESCGTAYGEIDPNNHDLTIVDNNGVCGCGQSLTFVITNSGVNKNYDNLVDALAAWTDNTTLTLFSDVLGLTEYIKTFAKGLILDLNGHKIECSHTLCTIWIEGDSSSELTIRDGKGGGYIQGSVYAVSSRKGLSTLRLESGTVETVSANGDFTMTGGCIAGDDFFGLGINSEVEVIIDGGEIYGGRYGILNYCGNLTVSGTAKITATSGCAIDSNVDGSVVVSGTPTISGGTCEFTLGAKITLNTQPAYGEVWRVKIDSYIEDGIFAIPGEGVTLDMSKFASAMNGYEVKQNAKGELLLCNHQTAYAAASNEDGSTHKMLCYCGETTVEASVVCSGFGATCQTKAVCVACGQSYGETNPDAHTFNDDGKCACGADRGEAVNIDLSTLTETYVISNSGEYIFEGSGSYGIKVASGNPRIVLNNANITVGEDSAIDVASGSTTTIFVMGDNTIDTDSMWETAGGIFVAEGGTVNITSNGTDNILRAHGTLAAAIGGKYVYDNNESYNAGNISISNVTVYTYTNDYHAAAIGAAGNGTCGTINITNAVVYAYGAGDNWTSAPGIGSAWGLVGWAETIPVVIISDSEIHTFRYNYGSDYIGYLGDIEIPMNATGSINCGEGGSVKSSTIYCYTGLDATITDKVVTYNADGTAIENYTYDEATNTYTVYSNDFFQTAINDAKISGTAENPATIKLMADIEATGVLNEYGFVEQDVLIDNGVITLDLNGYTLTGMSGNRVICVTNGASLTIDDSSENKLGKVVGLENDEYYIYTLNVDGGNLVVNNGNFEGRRAVWGSEGGNIVINGGTFKATYNAVEARESSSLTITGGTFISDEYALCLATTANVMGGTFIGGKHDITTTLTQIFTYNENGEGPYFPGGLSTNDSNTLNNFLADGAAYYDAEGNKLTLAENARSCDGDITVRADN